MKWITRENANVDRVACPWRHAADVSADVDTSPYGRGLRAIAHGFAAIHGKDDHKKIALEMPMYDALYAFFQHELEERPAA